MTDRATTSATTIRPTTRKELPISRTEKERIGERVTIYQRGRTWWASYQLDRRQQRESLQTTNRKEARRKGQIIDVELQHGQRKAPVPHVAISTAIAEYLQHLRVE
ncbi:MAG: hypothetical protein KDA58_15760, partial [Planctomycetaceae bacterium]|nr:hypothetical protein [Planctomycetaceae bacterium]